MPISNSAPGRDVAGVFAARTRSGLAVDAIGVLGMQKTSLPTTRSTAAPTTSTPQ
ncbi:hypothetical protein [Paenarthrobacter nitroguajacolicus]|uniref:hypothetical protein n=1 Tax=Paenarthrobacter nitroguajacolicus TaxID=211146 RepID=UPI001AAFE798|nr:hypothetical protein [Paenarthrobacter nitroguajacolicus]